MINTLPKEIEWKGMKIPITWTPNNKGGYQIKNWFSNMSTVNVTLILSKPKIRGRRVLRSKRLEQLRNGSQTNKSQ